MNWFEKMKLVRRLKRGNIDAEIQRIAEAIEQVKLHTKEYEQLLEDDDPSEEDRAKLMRAYNLECEEYKRLGNAMEQQLKNKKLVKEMQFMGISPEKILLVAVILAIAGFGFALDMESPKAIKIAQFVLGLVRKV